MKRSIDRILTTHAGSLPRTAKVVELLLAEQKEHGRHKTELNAAVSEAIKYVAGKQVECGIDIVNDGEQGRTDYTVHVLDRLAGFEGESSPPMGTGEPEFPELAEMLKMFASPFQYRPKCSGDIGWKDWQAAVADIELTRAAMKGIKAEEIFMTSPSPGQIARYLKNAHYKTEEEYLFALAEAMRVEYKAVVDAGFILQVDDPRLITHYNRMPGITMEENRKFIELRVEVLNHALEGIPEEKVRFHTCYSINVAPRVHDLEMQHYVDLMLKVKAQGYSIEAANPRHEHEWRVWNETKLPDNKVLIPGVVSHCVYQVEHPELVADRLEKFASIVGRERVIAGTDCGFATSRAGDELHPDVAWAKLQALVDGAKIATKRLWN